MWGLIKQLCGQVVGSTALGDMHVHGSRIEVGNASAELLVEKEGACEVNSCTKQAQHATSCEVLAIECGGHNLQNAPNCTSRPVNRGALDCKGDCQR